MMGWERALKSAGISMASCLLGACVGPLVPVVNVEASTANELSQSVPAFAASQTPVNATVLGPLTATSCKNKLWDRDASSDDATNQLRLLARQRGGDAVGNLVCEQPRGTDLSTNCWASITCTGTAIRTVNVPGPKRGR